MAELHAMFARLAHVDDFDAHGDELSFLVWGNLTRPFGGCHTALFSVVEGDHLPPGYVEETVAELAAAYDVEVPNLSFDVSRCLERSEACALRGAGGESLLVFGEDGADARAVLHEFAHHLYWERGHVGVGHNREWLATYLHLLDDAGYIDPSWVCELLDSAAVTVAFCLSPSR